MDILTAKANENELDYFSFGRGNKPLVIIPGLSLTSVMQYADSIAKAYEIFAADYLVYVFDMPKILDEHSTVASLADDIAAVMKTLCIENVCVFGASMGGMLSQTIAVKYQNLVKKLVLGSSCSRMNDMSTRVLSEWAALANEQNAISLNKSIYEHLYSKETLDSLSSNLPSLYQNGTADEMSRFALLALSCLNFDIFDSLNEISCPVLTIGAQNDNVLGVNASIEIAKKIDCELFVYEEFGHAVYDEAPDYKQRIFEFFA